MIVDRATVAVIPLAPAGTIASRSGWLPPDVYDAPPRQPSAGSRGRSVICSGPTGVATTLSLSMVAVAQSRGSPTVPAPLVSTAGPGRGLPSGGGGGEVVQVQLAEVVACFVPVGFPPVSGLSPVPVHVADRCRHVHRHGAHKDRDGAGGRPPDPRCDHREPDEQPRTDHARKHPPGAPFREPIGESHRVEQRPTPVEQSRRRDDRAFRRPAGSARSASRQQWHLAEPICATATGESGRVASCCPRWLSGKWSSGGFKTIW
ncbi:MAG: hypothetical protein JWN32_2345 [Solirubrobacterales bacterium]|nr:hypothetical protein [Solirubrobacterales bacterium]